MQSAPVALTPFWQTPPPADPRTTLRGNRFPRDIQPILDRHCISCHGEQHKAPANAAPKSAVARAAEAANAKTARASANAAGVANANAVATATAAKVLVKSASPDLRAIPAADRGSKRTWLRSYLNLTHHGRDNHPTLNWISAASAPPIQPPRSAGAATSRLFALLDKGHGKTKITPQETALLAAWVDTGVPFCGDYTEAAIWSPAEQAKHHRYQAKRQTATLADTATLRKLASEK
jgi:hypothetical protein